MTIVRALAGAGAELTDLEILSLEERLQLMVESVVDNEHGEDLIGSEEISEWAMQAVAERMDSGTVKQIAKLEGPVFRAVRLGDLALLEERIAAGDDIDQVFEVTQDTPLTQAIQRRDENLVRRLIEAGANVNHVGYGTPLNFALPDLRFAKMLIDASADVYGRGLDRMTPLERAVHRAVHPHSPQDSLLLVRFFLETGVHPPSSELGEGGMLTEAEVREAWEVYHELLPHYPEETARESFEELQMRQEMRDYDGGLAEWAGELSYAVEKGDVQGLRETLSTSKDLQSGKKAEKLGLTLIGCLALPNQEAENGTLAQQLEAAQLLIDAGADLNVAEEYEKRRGSTALAVAAESWHAKTKQVLRLLLAAGADINQRGHAERTPLMYAVLVAYRHGAALKRALAVLLDAGADVQLKDRFGHTAWTLAKAPLIEDEEGWTGESGTFFFDGPDLSDYHGAKKTAAGSRLTRCRKILSLLEEAGAEAHGEAELRLMLAAAKGDAKRLGEVLAAGANADACDIWGRAAIVAAAESGNLEAVTLLIEAGCEVDTRVPGGASALEVAVRSADLAMTRHLLAAGANPVMMFFSSSSLLAEVEAAGGTDVVRLIRDALPPSMTHADRDIEQEMAADDRSWASQSELPSQAAMGDLARVRELLAVDGVQLDGFDGLKRTALLAAAEAGQIEVVRELIARGADVNLGTGVVGSPRSTPLAAAAIGSSGERGAVLRLLLDAGADPDLLGADGRTALMHAVERDVGFFGRVGDFALSTQTLIEAGADLDIRDPFGLTAWMRGMSLFSSVEIKEVSDQYKKVADLLLEADASMDGWEDVELVWAASVGQIDRLRELLELGGSPSARRHDGATALILATRNKFHEIVEILMQAGADVQAREWGDRGQTAREAATECRFHDIARMLKEAGG